MTLKARARVRAMAHEAMIALEGVDANAKARTDEPRRVAKLEKDIEKVRAFILKMIGA